MSTADNATLVALISAVCGGFATKLLDHVFGVRKNSSDIAIAERKLELDADSTARIELRSEAQRHRDALLRAEAEAERLEAGFRAAIKRLEDDRDQWREKYFSHKETGSPLARIVQIQEYLSEIESLRDQVKNLQQSNDDLTARIRSITAHDRQR